MRTADKVIKTRWGFGGRQAARQCIESMPSDGLQSRQFLPIQRVLRDRRESGTAGDIAKHEFTESIGEQIEEAVVEMAIEEPAWGQVRMANELKNKEITVSAAGVCCVWLRHDLRR